MTCRELGNKASHGCFTSYFRRKRVGLTPRSLTTLLLVMRQVPQARILQDLAIIGTILTKPAFGVAVSDGVLGEMRRFVVEEDGEETRELLGLLAEAFGNLGKICPEGGKLRILRLELTMPSMVIRSLAGEE